MSISEELQEAVDEIKRFVDDRMRTHELSYHDFEVEKIFYSGATPVSVARLVQEHNQMSADMSEIASAFLGTPRTALMGGGRSNDGVVKTVESQGEQLRRIGQDVEYLKKKADEPSVTRLKFSPAVWVAVLSGFAAIIVAIVESWGG